MLASAFCSIEFYVMDVPQFVQLDSRKGTAVFPLPLRAQMLPSYIHGRHGLPDDSLQIFKCQKILTTNGRFELAEEAVLMLA